MTSNPSPIFSDEQVISYAKTRLFGGNIKPEDITHIELHNGVMPQELEKKVIDKHGMFHIVDQKNAREPIFFADGNMYIPQWSGHGRAQRYEDMIEFYQKVSEHDFTFKSLSKDNDSRIRNQAYTNCAYDFVTGLFVPNKRYEGNRVFDKKNVQNIDTIVFGPTKTVADMCPVVIKGDSPYIDCQIVKVGDKEVLNIGYVYSDQARSILDKMFREYQSIAENRGKKIDIKTFMFGRVASLSSKYKRHDLIRPNGVMSRCGDHYEFDMVRNILNTDDKEKIYNYNVRSVMRETIEELNFAALNDCKSLDMELWKTNRSIAEANMEFQDYLNIRFGFVGHVSDRPRHLKKDGTRDTLAEELDSDLGERSAFEEIKGFIENS